MKIIVTTISPSLDTAVDPRFGRAAYFVVVDLDTMEWQAHMNPSINSPGGAGMLAAQFVANQKAEAVISGSFGPNAYNALVSVGVKMYSLGASQTGREAAELFKAGKLNEVSLSGGSGRHQRGW